MRTTLLCLISLVSFLAYARFSAAGYCRRYYTCYSQRCSSSWWRRRCSTYATTCSDNICCDGFTGSSCDIVLHCVSGPCQNDGNCTDIYDDYNCTCKEGTRGRNCEEISCGTTPTIDNSSVTVTGSYEGSNATYSCDQHFELVGGSGVLSCLSNGSWSGQIPSCNLIDCGSPESIPNGHVAYTNTFFGSTAMYNCNVHYNMSGGSEVRTCQSNRIWNGSLPACIFVNHCGSNPCNNGAPCSDLLDDYACTCLQGWSGKNCDTDIQPPIMSGCSPNITINATETTKFVEWEEPSFTDPFGNDMYFTKNYQTPSYDFPWGDFPVQYTATKLNNGLRLECNFTISVRPTPCVELNVPANGARLCNGWKQDYGRFCLVTCNLGHMIDPEYSFDMMYVCGASGIWSPSSQLPDCNVSISSEEALLYHSKYSYYSYNSTCSSIATGHSLQQLYIDRLNGTEGEFADFCNIYSEGCLYKNVEVTCANID